MRGFKIEPGFFPDIALKKTINNRQINRLPTSLASGDCLRAASASRVAAKLARTRTIVMVRRNQRSEVCNEIRVVINMDIPLILATLWMSYLICFISKQVAFVINMTLTSKICTSLRAFKLITTCFAAIKRMRLGPSGVRAAEPNKFQKELSNAFCSIHRCTG
jgi:hypothetical protein